MSDKRHERMEPTIPSAKLIFCFCTTHRFILKKMKFGSIKITVDNLETKLIY